MGRAIRGSANRFIAGKPATLRAATIPHAGKSGILFGKGSLCLETSIFTFLLVLLSLI